MAKKVVVAPVPNILKLIGTICRLSTQNSDDWTSGWDTWGQDNHSSEANSKTKKSTKGKTSKSKKDEHKNKLIDFGSETEEKTKKSALSDAWDNDGWETLNKDD